MRIFLLGFMGTGKSHWGKRWAEAYNMKFVDLDEVIELKENASITEIFDKKSEEYFRLLEAKTLHSLAVYDHALIACGGGTPCFFDNMEWMKAHGTTIFLEATPAYILGNIKNEITKRPLLKNHASDAELLFFIEQKLKERNDYYEQADIIKPITEVTVEWLGKVLPAAP